MLILLLIGAPTSHADAGVNCDSLHQATILVAASAGLSSDRPEIAGRNFSDTAHRSSPQSRDSLTSTLQSAFAKPAILAEPSAAAIATLAFRPDPSITRREGERAAEFSDLDESRSPATVRGLRSGKLLKEFNSLLTRHDYDPDNLGDVLAAYTLLMWEIVADRDSSDVPAGQGAVRRQLVGPLAALPQMAQLSNEAKQRRAERTAYQSMLAIYAFRGAKKRGDRRRVQHIQSTVSRSFKKSAGIDLATLELTSGGLVAH